jgi:hypothetical protein
MRVSGGSNPMKTAPTNKKIRELISAVREFKIIPRPEFQRRLVWSRDDKNLFLDTILRGYPFPELYLADGNVNLETSEGTQLLVDGLQRVSTIIQYFEGDSDLKLTTVPPYKELSDDEKKAFLQYDVAVRDLGSVAQKEIVEVFKRLNATKYSLLEIEVNNAIYAGAIKQFAEMVAANPLFETHSVFNSQDLKRMGDLRYALTLVITLLEGYFNRDDSFEAMLDRYNDDFPVAEDLKKRLGCVFEFIEECGFEQKSRVWRKADLFTLIIELDQAINVKGEKLQPGNVVADLTDFYTAVNGGDFSQLETVGIYYKATVQASNDRLNRIRRGVVIYGILLRESEPQIIAKLALQGLI